MDRTLISWCRHLLNLWLLACLTISLLATEMTIRPPYCRAVPAAPETVNGWAIDHDILEQAIALSRFDAYSDAGVEPQDRTIRDMIGDLAREEQDYLDQMQNSRSSYGLFAVTDYDYDLENDESRLNAGLEWRLFNDGYFEAIREDGKKILQTRLEFYQMRRDMIERLLEEDLYRLSTIENQVRLSHFKQKLQTLAPLLEKRSQQVQHGYTTRIDVFDIQRQLQEVRQEIDLYQGLPRANLNQEQLTLLNRIERIGLKPFDHLKKMIEDASYDLKIQDTFIERSDTFPRWSDELAINVNAAHRKEFDETERQIIGFEVEIPLAFDRQRQSLIDTQKRIYRYQKEAVQRRLQQQLDRLCTFFIYQQRRLAMKQDQLALLLMQFRDTESKRAHSIQSLDDDPDRTNDLLTLRLIDGRNEALETRLKVYEVILKLLALTQAADVTELFEFR